MKKEVEMQGPDIVPDDLVDTIFIRNKDGELIELEIVGDEQC